MGVMIGFVAGYVFGTRAGDNGYQEMMEALRTILGSSELKEVAGGVVSMVGDLLRQGTSALGEGSGAQLRRIA